MSRTITLSEVRVGTINPVFEFDDTVVSLIGGVRTDSSNPTSPTLAGSPDSFFPPVHGSFSVAVRSVSFDVGFLNDLGSTRVTFYDAAGNIIRETQNTVDDGFQRFGVVDETVGISSFTVSLVGGEAGGFGVDNITVGRAVDVAFPVLDDARSVSGADYTLGNIREDEGRLIADTLSPRDRADKFSFFVDEEVEITWRVFSAANPDGFDTFTRVYDEGFHAVTVEEEGTLLGEVDYVLEIQQINSVANAVQDGLDRDALALLTSLVEGGSVEESAIINALEAAVSTADDALRLLDRLTEQMGNLGKIADAFLSRGELLDAADPAQEAFAQLIELLGALSAVGVGAGIGTLTGPPSPVISALEGLSDGVVYSDAVSDALKSTARTAWRDFFTPAQQGEAPIRAAQLPAFINLDEEFYLAEYREARQALQSGEYGSVGLYFLLEGAALGHRPNANAGPINPGSLREPSDANLTNSGAWASATTLSAGRLRGDGLSDPEVGFLDGLSDERIDGIEFDPNLKLTAVANRFAIDLALNRLNDPTVAAQIASAGGAGANGAAEAGGQGLRWSDGQTFQAGAQAFAGQVGDASAFWVVTNGRSPGDSVDQMMASAARRQGILDPDNTSVGVGEYGGVWVVVTSPNAQGQIANAEADRGLLRRSGTKHDDDIILGTRRGIVEGGDGSDELTGGPGADTLLGGRGRDTLIGEVWEEAARVVGLQRGDGIVLNTDAVNNHQFDAAFDVSKQVDTGQAPDVLRSLGNPYVSIQGRGFNAVDYYSFIIGGSDIKIIADIDYGSGAGDETDFDSLIIVFDSVGNEVARNNNAPAVQGAGGSNSNFDSFLETTLDAPGRYVISVSSAQGSGIIPVKATYTLQLTILDDFAEPTEPPRLGEPDDRLIGGDGADLIRGAFGDDTISGGNGNDQIFGGPGDDFVQGQDGRDSINGGAGDDDLFGQALNDRIEGGGGDDTMNGGAQADRIFMGLGADRVVTGLGADMVLLEDPDDEMDIIVDFKRGGDKLNLTLVDANTNTGAMDRFDFIGDAFFSGNAGEVRFIGWRNLLVADTDGDRQPDFMVQFNGVDRLTEGDLII